MASSSGRIRKPSKRLSPEGGFITTPTKKRKQTVIIADPNRKQLRLQYDRANLQLAYEATCLGVSVRRAAKQYHVPESTLRDRTRGKVSLEISIGFKNIFTEDEEQALVDHVEYMASIGHGYDRKTIKFMGRDYAESLGKDLQSTTSHSLSNRWFYGFLKRWPDLKLLRPQKQSLVKAETKENLEKYFKELSAIVSKHGLEDKPERIFTIDEIGIAIEPSRPKTVRCNDNSSQSVTPPSSSTVMIIAGGNAVGHCLPPYYVYPGKRWMNELISNAPPGSSGGMSENGGSNSKIFHSYITKHLAKNAGITDEKDHPVTLILYDAQKSHISLTLAVWAKKHNVILFVLPPSRLRQPLDVAVFQPFKKMYNNECQQYLKANPGVSITRYEVAGLTAIPYMKALASENLISGFRKTGIYPVDRAVIASSEIETSTIYSKNDVQVVSACELPASPAAIDTEA